MSPLLGLSSLEFSLQPISYADKPVLKLYSWKERGIADCCVTEFALGHVALDIKVPLNWYQHRIFKEKPLITDDSPTSYNLYKDDKGDIQVIIVHDGPVSETLNLTKIENSDEYLYDDEIARCIGDDSLHNQIVTFPEKLSEWIAASCQYRHDQDYFYLSFVPENPLFTKKKLLRTSAECLSREIEWKNEGKPDETITVNNLNHRALYANAIQLRHRIEPLQSSETFADLIQWGTWRHNQTCSSLILSLLGKDEVGATQRVPAFGHSGTLSSLLLLSLRPAFTLSVLYPLCYELIVDDSTLMGAHRHRRHHGSHSSTDMDAANTETTDLLIASLLVFVSVGFLSRTEKWAAEIFCFLKNTACRQRELVEIRSSDFIVQCIGFCSVPLLSLWWNFQVFERQLEWNTEALIALDSGVSFMISLVVYLGSTYLTSQFLYLLQHGCLQTPALTLEMVHFIKKSSEIPQELLEWQFKKEWALNIITGLSLLANIVTLRYATYIEDNFDDQPIFFGGTAALFVSGYIATKFRINYLDQQQALEKAELEKKKPMSEGALKQLRSHEPKPGLFFLIAFSGSALMLIAAEKLPNDWPFEVTLLMTTLSGVLAYIGSLLLYYASIKARDAIHRSMCPGSFFCNTTDVESQGIRLDVFSQLNLKSVVNYGI